MMSMMLGLGGGNSGNVDRRRMEPDTLSLLMGVSRPIEVDARSLVDALNEMSPETKAQRFRQLAHQGQYADADRGFWSSANWL